MAIVLPLLLLILFGVIDMGRLLQQQIQLTEAVREGARVGALNGTPATMQTQVGKVVGTTVTLTYPTTTACTSSAVATDNATVTAQRTFTAITPMFSLMAMFGASAGTVTLKATGVMACLG